MLDIYYWGSIGPGSSSPNYQSTIFFLAIGRFASQVNPGGSNYAQPD